jgi:hypothetical protein
LYPFDTTEYQSGVFDVQTEIALEQNYPNPFAGYTYISYSISKPEKVNITIYDMFGKEVAQLVNEYQAADSYIVRFDAGNLPEGMYFYKLVTGDNHIQSRKMMHIR